MSLDREGFDKPIGVGIVYIQVENAHPLLKLCSLLDWGALLELIWPDLKRTNKRKWWLGRSLFVRIHLGVYLLQQLFNLTNRGAERALRDNAAFRLFCGLNIVKKWHVPDHMKIEEFRSRLLPETQRQLANHLATHAGKLKYANPCELDVDSTVQEANMSYPSRAGMLIKLTELAKRITKPLNELKDNVTEKVEVKLSGIKEQALHYFNLKRKGKLELAQEVLKLLWKRVMKEVIPVLTASSALGKKIKDAKFWNVRKAVEQLQWDGHRYLITLFEELFDDNPNPNQERLYSFHLKDVECFDKNKLNKKKEYGRAYQLGRVGGNFLIVGECSSVRMPDAQSLPDMLQTHEECFGKEVLNSVATDKGYYSLSNHLLLEAKGIEEIGLQRPQRDFNAPRNKTPGEIQVKLYRRRSGIEALIGHLKQGWQMGRSRMKSDRTILSSGYSSVLGFNLRQLMRYSSGQVRPLSEEKREDEQNGTENEGNGLKNDLVLA